jgi:hypothetical protein
MEEETPRRTQTRRKMLACERRSLRNILILCCEHDGTVARDEGPDCASELPISQHGGAGFFPPR